MGGDQQEESKQIVRSEPSPVQAAVPTLQHRIPAKYLPYVKGAVGLSLLGFAGWLLQNFLQLRGIVNLLASRIDLGFLFLALVSLGCLMTATFKWRKLYWSATVILCLLVVVCLDEWAPKPPLVGVSKTTKSTQQPPQSKEVENPVPQEIAKANVPNESKSNRPVSAGPLSLSPIEGLTELGWEVQPDENLSGVQFRLTFKSLPSMNKSFGYFRLLNRPFSLVILGAKTLDGLGRLEGIQNFRMLELNSGEFCDISPLTHLTSLTKLTITQGSKVSGISALRGLAHLTELSLSGPITDLTPIENLKNITTLSLDTPGVRDLTPIGNLTGIRELFLDTPRVEDIFPLSNLRLLKSLQIGPNSAFDLSPLARATNLTDLRIQGKQLPHLRSLPTSDNLTLLSISNGDSNVGLDLSSIPELPNLSTLDITTFGTSNLNLSPLQRFKRLKWLRVTYAGFEFLLPVSGVEVLGELPRLETLIFANLQIRDLIFVTTLNQLSTLSLARIPVSNIDAIRHVKSLKEVYLMRVPVVDISPLLDLPELTRLNLIGTPARADVVTELEKRGVKIQR
jgi:hypothetical protein